MKNNYMRTNWVDNKTPVNAANLNNIERGLVNLFANAISPAELKEGDGINITATKNGELEISTHNTIRSSSCAGIEFIYAEMNPMEYTRNVLYLYIEPSSNKLRKLILNGDVIYEVE